jgi:hypothetical protein
VAQKRRLSEEQEAYIVAIYNKLRHVQSWYWDHLAEWRGQLLKAAEAAHTAAEGYRLMQESPDALPPWVESEEDRELLRKPGPPIPVLRGPIPDGYEVEELTVAEVFDVEGLGSLREQTQTLIEALAETAKLGLRVERTTELLRFVAGDLGTPAQRGNRPDPEVALGVIIAEKTEIPLEWVQAVLDQHVRGGEGRAVGKLARKVRKLTRGRPGKKT